MFEKIFRVLPNGPIRSQNFVLIIFPRKFGPISARCIVYILILVSLSRSCTPKMNPFKSASRFLCVVAFAYELLTRCTLFYGQKVLNTTRNAKGYMLLLLIEFFLVSTFLQKSNICPTQCSHKLLAFHTKRKGMHFLYYKVMTMVTIF